MWGYELKLYSSDSPERVQPYTRSSFKDSLQLSEYCTSIIQDLHKKSYLLATIDSVLTDKKFVNVYIHVGVKYTFDRIMSDNVPVPFLNRAGFKEKYFTNRKINLETLISTENKILKVAADNGYPFASIKLSAIEIVEHKLKARLEFFSGPIIRFDSIIIRGSTRVSHQFLAHYLNIEKGKYFQESATKKVDDLLKKLPYLKIDKPSSILFKKNKAHVVIYAEHKNASSINGILGVLPNETEQGKVLITGDLSLRLSNLFSSGKTLKFDWQKVRENTQVLKVNYQHPDLLKSNFDIGVQLDLLKEDTSFFNMNRKIGLSYQFSKLGQITFLFENRSTRLLSTTQYNESNLPQVLDGSLNNYGIHWEWYNVNDYYYPKNGFRIKMKSSIGNKQIMKNTSLGEFVYDNYKLKSTQFEWNVNIEKYWKLGKQTVLLTKGVFNKIENEQIVLTDLFRVGGLNSLRGFNQNYFYAQEYWLGTAEFRVYTALDSYLFLFYDQARMKYELKDELFFDVPYGIGAGMSFTTKGGVFQFVYSLGNSAIEKLNPTLSKIHFGFTSQF